LATAASLPRYLLSAKAMEGPRENCRAAGFTLVELLVALVITSLLVSILMGLLFYVYRAQDSLRSEVVDRESQLRARAWFSEALAECLPADAGSGAAFAGNAKEISCDSLAPLRPQSVPGTQRISFSLSAGTDNQTQLIYSERGESAKKAVPIVNLPAGDAGFLYADVNGKEVDFWPPTRNNPETLPRRIRLVVKASSEVVFEWLATPRADPWLEPVIKNPFGLELPR
jgi:prepilin-type N-terminal cleavage/methylation domain-containing protein